MYIFNCTRTPSLPAQLREFEEAVYTGSIVMTPGVQALIKPRHVLSELSLLLAKHIALDTEHLSEDDAEVNRESVPHGDRIMTVYKDVQLAGADPIPVLWVITDSGWKEGHRVTTFLLPEEY